MPPFPTRPSAPEIVLRTSGSGGPHLARGGARRFTPEAKAVFLDHLAASCNVCWSAAQAGVSAVTAYNHRRSDAGFARGWEAALREGQVRLETGLVATAIACVARLRSDEDLPLTHMTVRDALALLRHQDASRGGPTARGGRFRPRPRSPEEARDSILAKLVAIEAMRRQDASGSGAGRGDGES